MKNSNIKGRIIDLITGKGIQSLLIEAWSAQKGASAPLTTASTKKNGAFDLSFADPATQEADGRQPEILLKIYRESALLKGPYLELVFNLNEWDDAIAIEVELEGKTTEPAGETAFTVKGTVYDPAGRPAAGVLVKISDQQLRSAILLGEAMTGENGRYSIPYTAEALTKPASSVRTAPGYPDLSAAVYGKDGTLLYQSTLATILYNAPRHATLNVTLDVSSRPQPIEFDTILSTLTPLMKGVTFDQLGETTQNQDITFLSNETGIDFTYLEYFVLSYKVQQQFQILPSFTYALLREGTLQNANLSSPLSMRTVISVNADITGLAYDIVLLPTASIQAGIATATQQFIIDDLSALLPGILTQLEKLQQAAQNYVQNERPQQLLNMVTSSLTSGAYQGLVQALGKNYYGDIPGLLNAIAAANPFTSAAPGAASPAAPAAATTPGAASTAAPAAAPTPDAKAQTSARPDLGGLLKTEVHKTFLSAFEKDEHHLFPAKENMLDALRKTPEADLGKGNIDAQVQHLKLPEDTRRDLRKLQRLYKLVPHYEQAKVLHQDGLHAGFHIVALGKKQFVRKYTQNNTFTKAEALKVYQKASTTHTAALELAGQLRDYASLGRWKAIGGAAITAKITAVNIDFPNYQSLFQGINYCDCQDCRNVYSPAAYMVDVLQFLNNRLVMGGTKTARDVLFSRRPDLGNLDLNCDNAYTELPYIDLVCEILEDAVSPDPGLPLDATYTADLVPGAIDAHLLTALQGAGYSVTSAAIIYPSYLEGAVTTFILRDTPITLKIAQTATGWTARELRQTHLSQAELLACPEYVNSAAYTLLQGSDISFSLPFDLYQEEAESLLRTAGVQRANLMAAFQVPAALTEASIAAVALGISPLDMTLIVTPAPASQFMYWNTSAASLLTTVNEVDVFLQKSNLTYTDLQNLLAQSFINPTNAIYIQHEDSTCNPAHKTLINLDLNALDRMHRFIRLWNKTGLSMQDLNRVITYPDLGNNNLNNQVLVFLYGLQNLENALGITLDQALSFYGLIPSDSDAELYQSIFLNLVTANPVDPAFNLINIEANEALPAASQDTLANHQNTLCLCLRRKPADITLILSQLSTLSGVAQPPLTRANLAFLYSNGLLAASIGLSLQDMYNLSSLSGQLLFTSPAPGQFCFTSPDATNAFIQTVNFVLNNGFSVSDLEWFLADTDPTGLRAISDAGVTTFLKTLQTGYQAAFTATVSPFQPGATPQENLNGLKQILGMLPGITAQSVNQVVSVVNNTWTTASPTAAQLIANVFESYFSPAVITLLQNDVTALQGAGGSAIQTDQTTLIGDLCSNASQYLYTSAKNAALYAAADTLFGTPDVVTQVILNNAALHFPPPGLGNPPLMGLLLTDDSLVDKINTPPQPPVITPAAFDLQYRAVRLLNMIVAYYNKISPTASDFQWFLQNNSTMGWLALDQLPYEPGVPLPAFRSWVSFQQALQLMTRFPPVSNPTNLSVPLEWKDVWNQVINLSGAAALLTTLVQFTGWDPVDVNALAVYFGYTYPATTAGIAASSYAQPSTYLQLSQTTGFLSLLGMDLSDFEQIIQLTLTATQAGLIMQALRNQYTDAQWPLVIQPVMDALRPQKRDALVTYLLAMNPTMQGTDDLYDYFLVDVEMQPGTPTSRIVLAHGTLQLFIQRCLMALEPQATADLTDDDGWAQWSWMSDFQVWVANRKIFVYPENWFAPDLRSSMSPFFSDLINNLQQNQVTEANVETAAITYLDDLDNVANLDVRACYYDVNTFLFHVIARVRGGSAYYYRTCLNESAWSAWTQVNVDISGDCLLCFVRNSRLYMAWPLFAEDTQQESSMTVPTAGASASAPPPQKRYLVQLATSELVDGTWQPKLVSQDTLPTNYVDGDQLPASQDSLRMINFDLGAAGDNIVCTFVDSGGSGPYTLGTFSLSGCKGYPVAVSWTESIPDYEIIPQFDYTNFEQMQYQQEASPTYEGLIAKTILNPYTYRYILQSTPSLYEVIYPHEFSLLDYIYILLELLSLGEAGNNNLKDGRRQYVIPMASFMPFFYEDSDRDYVIFPGFYSQDGITTYTFSGIYTFVQNVIALIVKYIEIYLADPTHNLANLIAELVADPTYQDLLQQWTFFSSTQSQFMFMNFYHSLVCTIKAQVYSNGLPSIFSYAFQSQQTSFNFQTAYAPETPPAVPSVALPYPVENIDFTATGSYSLYNWELFYDLPFYVANQLTQAQQFQDAQTWYNYIFNPTGGQGGTPPQNYWITKPFHEFSSADYIGQRIDTILTDIAQDPSGVTITNLVNAVNNWRSQPFMPDVVASTRQVAYQKAVFIAYVNFLIAWGDYLFTQNTTETRVQATNLYILADELMGPQPAGIPPVVPVPDETYNQMASIVDVFGNALIDLENLVPNLNVLPQKGAELPPSTSFSLLYFCIPPNDTLTTLWATIADRLYKLRNSEDINGNYSSVPLFAPEINPGLLVRAAAAGVSISSILADLNAPLPYYRFRVLSQKATELATQISNLGNALLSALEKKDAEMLSQLRSGQEVALQTQILQIRDNQVVAATQAIAELQAAQAISQDKYNYYSSRPFMNTWEITQATLAGLGIVSQIVGTVLEAVSGGAQMVPSITAGAAGIGGSPLVTVTFGGENVGNSTGMFASLFKTLADILQTSAGLAGNMGSFNRRQDDWTFQAGQATLEIADYNQKINVANISKEIASQEVSSQQIRISQASAMLSAIQTKYTNEALYSWMISQISAVYYQAYQLAYSIAKQAEQCYQYELATESSFIQFGYWNSGQKGLLAGDQLLAAIKQMEVSYLNTNRRDYELVKNVSLVSLNPRALLQLINTGSCDFSIPEFLFDMDYPGQYLRRLKTVSVTIPCVAGPLTTVACTLTLVGNQYRESPLPLASGADTYAESPAGGDSRFVYNTGFIQAIALSSAQNDNGLFELNFDDERYLPFEGLGAIGAWHLQMNDPAAFAQFDYQTITDVILQLKYTSREGGSQLRGIATTSLKGVLKSIATNTPAGGLFRAFDLKHDFPNNWYAFMTDGSGTYNLPLSKVNFPFYTQNNLLKLSVMNSGLFVETTASGMLQVGIGGAAPSALSPGGINYGPDIQYADPQTIFMPVLQKTTDSATFSAAFSNFSTVSGEITGAWLILNYDLG